MLAPVMVLSHTKYNEARGIVVVTPLTSTLKPTVKMMIPIPEGFKARRSVIAEQVRIDLNRWWKTTGEVLPVEFVACVVETFKVIIS